MISIIRPVVYKIYFAGIVKVASHIHIDRIADALGFDIPSESGFANMAEVLLKRGY